MSQLKEVIKAIMYYVHMSSDVIMPKRPILKLTKLQWHQARWSYNKQT